ncbi:MAG: CocE/NonD family hydrolase [Thermoleophilaceae bacterium]
MRGLRLLAFPAALAALMLAVAVPAAASPNLQPRGLRPAPAKYAGVATTKDVPIVMRDGTKLFADVHRPARADGSPEPGRFPVILTQDPYAKNESTVIGADPLFIRRGYVQVIVDVRGTGSSEGNWDSFGAAEQRDSLEIARWTTRQRWSSGDLVLYGPSYMAINQIFTAAQHPKGLRAIFPIVPAEDVYRDVTWHGGAVDTGFIPFWLGLVSALKILPPNYLTGDPAEAVKLYAQRLAGGTQFPVQALTGGTTGGSLAYDGPFYRLRSPGRVVKRVHVPTFVTGGWYDLFQRGEPRLYRELPLSSGRKKLLMGPWYHVTGARGAGLGERGAPPPLDVLALAWFERWVRGKRNGIGRYGPVTVQQLNTKRWEVYKSYPRRDVRYRRFNLGDHVLTAREPKAGANTMPANQLAGLCSRSTTQWTAGIDQLIVPGQPCTSHNELNEAGALTYTGAALKRPLHLSGPLSLTLSGSTTAKDTTWVVTVSDVSPSGQSNQITAGWLVQSRRALDRARSTFGPGGQLVAPFHPFTKASLLPVISGHTDRMAIEIFNTDAVLAKGHRLRVTISSGDVPHMMAPAPDSVNGAGAVNTVHFGARAPSFLTAGVAPLGTEPNPKRAGHR